MRQITRRAVFAIAGACALALSACTPPQAVEQRPLTPMGDFKLGYAIVVAKNAQPIAPTRKATPEEWEAAIKTEVERRFGRYDGDRFYHVAISLDAFALAVPGVPVVVSPKSAVVASVTIWDDEKGAKLNEEPKQLTVLESFSGETVIGSGLTKTREQQMQNLAENLAGAVERYMVENRAEWFGETAEAAADAAPPAGDVAPETPPGSATPETAN